MRPFTPRKRTSAGTSRPGCDQQTIEQVLAGLDDAHRRELETMLEDSRR